VFAAGGNPYGPSVTTGNEGRGPTEADLAHGRWLGERMARLARRLVATQVSAEALAGAG
jgi:NAD(P)H dehydrogenase (quinone)